MGDNLLFHRIAGKFKDRYSDVAVFEVTGGAGNFCAFIYQCKLNLDIDGAPTTYGYNNPNGKNHQTNLAPLESWHKNDKKVTTQTSQKVGLGNACGDPGDGSKGWKNFLNGNRLFYWAGLKAVTKATAKSLKLIIDDRDELEAGLSTHSKHPQILPKGLGYYPVIQDDKGPAPGYYISTTSVVTDANASAYDPNRYLDSSVVPYAVWANEWSKWKLGGKIVDQGDFGLAIRTSTGANTGFVFGDSGTPDKVGESSQKLHSVLGGSGDKVTFIVFPGSGNGRDVGKNPQALIPFKVLMNTMRLGPNAKELATHLAAGRDMVIPKTTLEMSDEQSRIYQNIMKAFSAWTITVS